MDILRISGGAAGRSRAVAHGPFVWAVAVSPGKEPDMAAQTRATLAVIEKALADAGSGKDRLLTATVYISDMNFKACLHPGRPVAWHSGGDRGGRRALRLTGALRWTPPLPGSSASRLRPPLTRERGPPTAGAAACPLSRMQRRCSAAVSGGETGRGQLPSIPMAASISGPPATAHSSCMVK
jgi:hypothetical protein